MPPEEAELRLETRTAGGWSKLPAKLLEKVLEAMQADGESKPQEGRLGFTKATAVVRQVCFGWQKIHDMMATRLLVSAEDDINLPLRRFLMPLQTCVDAPPRTLQLSATCVFAFELA